MVKHAIVSSKELGNCWLPARFVEGVRCTRVMQCTYPEKKTCKAVDAEIAHLHLHMEAVSESCEAKIWQLCQEQGRDKKTWPRD